MKHECFMQRALELAEKGLGLTRPNPPVGAVVVKQGKIIGEGFHAKAGKPHAERLALLDAGAQARGADIYVTLEPCSTTGKTGPCTAALLDAGIKRVFVASKDPNPKHVGRGLHVLKKQGLEVTSGICESEGDELIAAFSKHVVTGLPYLTLKLGTTLDGRIADARSNSQWITGVESRKAVQALRRTVDAVLVGRKTAQLDNPSLLPRPAKGRKPYRVVLDRNAVLPSSAKIFSDSAVAQTIYVTTKRDAPKVKRLADKGIMVIPMSSNKNLLKRLAKMGIMHVLCEGGGGLAASLMKQGLVDESWTFIAPSLLGAKGVPSMAAAPWSMEKRPQGKVISVAQLGEDVLIKTRW